VDGFKTRTPFLSEFSAHADYSLRLGGKERLIFLMDVFNLLDQKTVLITTPGPKRPSGLQTRISVFRCRVPLVETRR